MMRLRRLLLIALGIGTVFAAGVAAWLILRPVPAVTVIVKNTSGKAIVSVRLEHERGIEVLENLARVINLKTAKTLGLKIPQSLLLRADQIIE